MILGTPKGGGGDDMGIRFATAECMGIADVVDDRCDGHLRIAQLRIHGSHVELMKQRMDDVCAPR